MSVAGDYERMSRWYDAPHVAVLYKWAMRFPGGTVIELGVCGGFSTVAFLHAGCDTRSVDIAVETIGRVPRGWHGLPNWHLITADSLSLYAQTALPDTCDILFVDSDHGYRHCLDELKLYGPRVRHGGVILGHDTDQCQVRDAFDHYCEQAGLMWTDTEAARIPHWHGLGVIRP